MRKVEVPRMTKVIRIVMTPPKVMGTPVAAVARALIKKINPNPESAT